MNGGRSRGGGFRPPGAGGERGERGERESGKFLRKPRKKICYFCKEKVAYIDYKDAAMLRRYVSDRGKIRARRVTGNCARHQQDVAMAVKNAREMSLLPYTIR